MSDPNHDNMPELQRPSSATGSDEIWAEPRILLTGATGYIGGRLLRRLQDGNRVIRCLARKPEYLRPKVASTTEVVQGDLFDPSSLKSAFSDVDVAFYLVHSMSDSDGFEILEQRSAKNFARAAKFAGVSKIIYLGGLGDGSELSPHLRSRQRVGRILRDSGVPTIEFRASVIIGAGSLSFELIRALVEKLPVMVTPRWVRSKAQPIAVDDVVRYLDAAVDLPVTSSQIFEIGGADQLSYEDLMIEYARQRGLRRTIIPVPVLSSRVSSLWLGLITPVYARVGRKLIESLEHDTIVTNNAAREVFDIKPKPLATAMREAIEAEDRRFADTRWSDALSSAGTPSSWGGVRYGQRLIDSRSIKLRLSTEQAFRPIRRIGGLTGWYFANRLWSLRGFLDLLAGGPGSRRGRRNNELLLTGDTLDFWRVEAVEDNRLLRLSAEMRLPGRAWLQFEIEPVEGGSRLRQTAEFDPAGLLGRIYWHGLFPVHEYVFNGMLREIARSAYRLSKE